MRNALRFWACCMPLTVVLQAVVSPALGALAVDAKLAPYQNQAQVTGRITSFGSDTMMGIMEGWTAGFCAVHSTVQVKIKSDGSGTAVPALLDGSSSFGPMSRKLQPAERDVFVEQFGYGPTQIRVGVDMLAVYVNGTNPIRGLTLQQVEAVFSDGGQVPTWGDLGLTGEWADEAILLFGRDTNSGTHSFFCEHALSGGVYRDAVIEKPSSHDVVGAVAANRFAIGYAGIGYQTTGVRAVPLSGGSENVFVAAVAANAYSGYYPLSRFLYLALNVRPGSRVDPLRREFLYYVFSRDGQQVVAESGFVPVPATVCERELRVLGLESKF